MDVKELLENSPELVEEIVKSESKQEFSEILNENGIILPQEQIDAVYKHLKSQDKPEGTEELNDDDFLNVAGGNGFKWTYLIPGYGWGQALYDAGKDHGKKVVVTENVVLNINDKKVEDSEIINNDYNNYNN